MAKKRVIAVTITADNRQLRRDLRMAGREVKSFERSIGGVQNRMRNLRQRIASTGVVGRGGGAIRTAAGFAGVLGVASMVNEARDLDARLTDIGITGGLTRRQLGELKGEMFAVAGATGKSTQQVLDFVDAVTVQTGNTQAARDALKDIGEVAVATGADMGDLGGVFVKLTANMKLGAKEAGQAFNILRGQEKKGSVTLANVAANFGKIAGAATPFGKSAQGLRGVQALGGLFQLTARGFGIGQEGEAANASAAFLRFLGQKGKQIKKTFGVDVTNKAGEVRDLPTVFEELGLAFNKDPTAFRKKGALIFGRAGVKTAFQLAAAAAGPGGFAQAQGKFAAANELFQAGGTNEIAKDAAKRRASDAFKFSKAMNDMRIQFQKIAMDILPRLTKALPMIGKAIKFLLDNSKLLFLLWAGSKGAQFFSRLLAPVGGGVTGGLPRGGGVMGAGFGVPGVGGGVGTAGRASALRGHAQGASVLGQGRAGTYLNPFMFQGPGGFGANRLSDAQMLNRERGRGRLNKLRSAGRGVGRGLATAGRGAAAAAPTALVAASMAPFAFEMGDRIGEFFAGTSQAAEDALRLEIHQGVMRTFRKKHAREIGAIQRKTAVVAGQNFFRGTGIGAQLDIEVEKTFENIFDVVDTEDPTDTGMRLRLGEVVGRRGKKGGKRGLETLKGTLEEQRASIRQGVRNQLGPGATEEQIQAAAPRLDTLNRTIAALDAAIARLVRGEGIKVTAVVDLKDGPARRLDKTAPPTAFQGFVTGLGL